jgi:hypothetical protein
LMCAVDAMRVGKDFGERVPRHLGQF